MSKYLKEPWTVRFVKWLAQYTLGLTWIWQKIMAPVVRRVGRVWRWWSDKYMRLWNKVVYKRDIHFFKWKLYSGDGMFSRMRAGLMIIATALSFYLIPMGLLLTYHTTLFVFTAQSEVVYLLNSEEVNPDEDTYSIRGCESLPCTEANAIYFRVRPMVFNHLYSLVTRGNLFYPDLVAAVVSPGVNKCGTFSFGIRLKTLMRRGDLYPDMLDAVCEPLGHNVEAIMK